mgnify:CR=1 FL=1
MTNLKIGDVVDLFIEEREDAMGQLVLSRRKAKLVKGWEYVQTALDKDEVIEGFVKRRTKGGLIVDVFGIEAFLPGSQIDVKPIRDFDIYVNKSIEVKVVKINYTNDNVVVSHKVLIEKDLEQLEAIVAALEEEVPRGVRRPAARPAYSVLDLTRTEHAQPALFALGYALWEEVRARLGLEKACRTAYALPVPDGEEVVVQLSHPEPRPEPGIGRGAVHHHRPADARGVRGAVEAVCRPHHSGGGRKPGCAGSDHLQNRASRFGAMTYINLSSRGMLQGLLPVSAVSDSI